MHNACFMHLFCSPPTHSQQQLCRDSVMEFTPDERDYSLLPAPMHVGECPVIRKEQKHNIATLSGACDCSPCLTLTVGAPGKYLRLKRIHFQLPYDVMWLWQHNQVSWFSRSVIL